MLRWNIKLKCETFALLVRLSLKEVRICVGDERGNRASWRFQSEDTIGWQERKRQLRVLERSVPSKS